MISIELAKELKEAGLQWEPRVGDWGKNDGYKEFLVDEIEDRYKNSTWLPSLSQMLKEIEGRGYIYHLINYPPSKSYSCFVSKNGRNINFPTGVLEEIVGESLLWILEQEGENA